MKEEGTERKDKERRKDMTRSRRNTGLIQTRICVPVGIQSHNEHEKVMQDEQTTNTSRGAIEPHKGVE